MHVRQFLFSFLGLAALGVSQERVRQARRKMPHWGLLRTKSSRGDTFPER